MFIIMAWGAIKAGAWDRFEAHHREKIIPLTKEMSGLKERQLWRDTEDSLEAVSWTVWDSLQELRSFETSEVRRDLAQEAEQYFQPLAYAKGEYWVKHFEIVSVTKP